MNSMMELSKDVIPRILSFLSLKEIMQKRRVSKKWSEAVKNTIVPPTDFRVEEVEENLMDLERYNAIVMTRALPSLQQITLGPFDNGHKYSDGEDPDDEQAAYTADWTTHDTS
jgi:hypothetical protein